MKYDVVQNANGTTTVVSSWDDNKNGAFQAFHHQCELLYSDGQTTKATVKVLDENLNVVDGKIEYINKVQA